MGMQPVPMTTDDLADLLRDLAEAVRTGDSLEGSLEYLLPTDEDESTYPGPVPADGLMVQASLRTGNRNGQGSMILIGRMVEDPPPAAEVDPEY